MRSVLFVPGTRPDRFPKALASGTDAVVFDLEDGVEASQKDKARAQVAEFFRAGPATPTPALRLVRFNEVLTPEGEKDLDAFVGLTGFDAVVLPKIESAAALEHVAKAFRTRAASRTAPPLIPLFETPRGILQAEAIAAADVEIPAILLGAEDLTARLAIPRTLDGEELIFARSKVVLAAALVGADAIDAVFTNIADLAGLRRDCERARALGLRGKISIHPAHVPVINEVFAPSAGEVERAQRVIAAFDAARASGEGVTTLDHEMIERPVVERARRVIALAARWTKEGTS
jgi:citrate lyase subunit beta / citryl-CoA lyase